MNSTATASNQFSPWPYAIIGYFVVFVTGIVVFIIWAVTQDMDLVRKDYYEQEILFQQQIDRQKRTADLGAQAAVNHDPARQTLTINIPASHVTGVSGLIHFYRPSDAKLDHAVRLAPATDGTQQINVQSLRTGLWKVAVQWTAGGQEYHLDRAIVIKPTPGLGFLPGTFLRSGTGVPPVRTETHRRDACATTQGSPAPLASPTTS